MPPEEAPRQPTPHERRAVVEWIAAVRDREARRNAGDPGPVLARRLSNAEFDYTIRDLTGVDIRPTREFPVDPANEAGFDNSGESLAMSPALLKKYLAAARRVADHLVLKPDGFDFAPEPAVTDTDRDKYCVRRIIDFYERHRVDYADYFLAAWRFQHRAALGKPKASLHDFAAEAGLSAKYLATVVGVLEETWPEAGPLGELAGPLAEAAGRRAKAGRGPARLRADARPRRPAAARASSRGSARCAAEGHLGRQSAVRPVEEPAARRRANAAPGEATAPRRGGVLPGLPRRVRRVRPAAVLRPQRGRTGAAAHGRLPPDARLLPRRRAALRAGPRRGGPARARRALARAEFRHRGPDAAVPGLHLLRARRAAAVHAAKPTFDFARSEDKDAISEAEDRAAARRPTWPRRERSGRATRPSRPSRPTSPRCPPRFARSSRTGARPSRAISRRSRSSPSGPIAGRCRRRSATTCSPSTARCARRTGWATKTRSATRSPSVLLSPHFCYRIDRAEPGEAARPLSDYALASRLSYFLWSSMPDAELLAHAAAGDLHQPAVLVAQARRMLRDDRVRGLATEFAGNWLGFRRFEEHNAVDRERFPSFTNELRQAMYEEPIRFFVDVVQPRSLGARPARTRDHTFVNPVLAKHYGMPVPKGGADEWVRVDDAERYRPRRPACRCRSS